MWLLLRLCIYKCYVSCLWFEHSFVCERVNFGGKKIKFRNNKSGLYVTPQIVAVISWSVDVRLVDCALAVTYFPS